MSEMNCLLILVICTVCAAGQELGVLTLLNSEEGERSEEVCVATRSTWTNATIGSRTFYVRDCEEDGYQSEKAAVIFDEEKCNVSHIQPGSVVLIKSPFSPGLETFLKERKPYLILQVHGGIEIGGQYESRSMIIHRVYWGAIVMYFVSLIYVTVSAVLIEAGRGLLEKHTVSRHPGCLNTKAGLATFLVVFFVILTVLCVGYLAKPILFQSYFAVFLCLLAIVGFYHAVFPLIVLTAVTYVRIVNKTYWTVEKISVLICGTAIFGLWFFYRRELNIWPLQVILLCFVGVVPIRYAPVNCIAKMIVFTLIGLIATVAKRWIVPMATGAPAEFLDIVTVQARLPDTFSAGAVFLPDAQEPNMVAFRIPLFESSGRPCSVALDATFGFTNFLLPALLIKASYMTDFALPRNVRVRNYTVAVVTFLLCHITVFLISYLTEEPFNANLVYLPGITLSVIINSARLGYLKSAMRPPSQRACSAALPTTSSSSSPDPATQYKTDVEVHV